ncbi:unnamed protein product, partial [Musa acuminata subsp. malaccensis]
MSVTFFLIRILYFHVFTISDDIVLNHLKCIFELSYKWKEGSRIGIARIRGYADAAHTPLLFTTTPALAIRKALLNTGLEASQVDYYEINEAFSVVALAIRSFFHSLLIKLMFMVGLPPWTPSRLQWNSHTGHLARGMD